MHHGIQGQKWGIRNGPPYPLGSNAHHSSVLYANGKASVSRLLSTDTYNGIGKTLIHEIKRRKDIKKDVGKPLKRQNVQEPIEASLQLANPSGERKNCANCSIAGVLRMQGYDVSARTRSVKTATGLPTFLKQAFDGARVYRFSEAQRNTFTTSSDHAASMLRKRYGDNASGIIGVQWKNKSSGHAFSWKIQNGKVEFLDFQSGKDDTMTRKYWKAIDPGKNIIHARLDNLQPNPEYIYEAVQNRSS